LPSRVHYTPRSLLRVVCWTFPFVTVPQAPPPRRRLTSNNRRVHCCRASAAAARSYRFIRFSANRPTPLVNRSSSAVRLGAPLRASLPVIGFARSVAAFSSAAPSAPPLTNLTKALRAPGTPGFQCTGPLLPHRRSRHGPIRAYQGHTWARCCTPERAVLCGTAGRRSHSHRGGYHCRPSSVVHRGEGAGEAPSLACCLASGKQDIRPGGSRSNTADFFRGRTTQMTRSHVFVAYFPCPC
jgi:hypothetical protein